MNIFYDLFKPKIFMNISTYILSVSMGITIAGFISLIPIGFLVKMLDFQQEEYVRIFYIHVSAAWIALFFYSVIVICSIIYLIYKSYFIYMMAQGFAHMGFYFSMLTLMTGSLWGKPTWGSYWVWDARLTSVFILFLLYMGYIVYNKIHEMSIKSMTQSSILAILGFINIPLIKYSVEWWNSLHQLESVTQNQITLDSSIYIPLLLCFISLLSYNVFGVILEMRLSLLKRKIESYYL